MYHFESDACVQYVCIAKLNQFNIPQISFTQKEITTTKLRNLIAHVCSVCLCLRFVVSHVLVAAYQE